MTSEQSAASVKELSAATIGIAIRSKLWRTKVGLALDGKVRYEFFELENLAQQVRELEPQIVIFDIYCLTERADLFQSVLDIPILDRPRVLVAGDQRELEQEVTANGVDGLLCFPFIPEMLLLKVRSLLEPLKNFETEQQDVLRRMRKYQRIEVENMQIVFYKPFRVRAPVLDVSYQGLKAKTNEIDASKSGTDVQIQLVHGGVILNLAAQLVWVREGMVGVLFKSPRPAAFDELIEKLYIQAFEG